MGNRGVRGMELPLWLRTVITIVNSSTTTFRGVIGSNPLHEWVYDDDVDHSSGGTSFPTAPIRRFYDDVYLRKTHVNTDSTLTNKSPKRK